MALFSAFSPLNGGKLSDYYPDREYPIDLNGALNFVRYPHGASIAYFPYPQTIGFVVGLIPLMDNVERTTMLGITPGGAGVDILSNPVIQPIVFPDYQGGLEKIGG